MHFFPLIQAILKKNFNVLIMNVIFEEICAETDDEFDIMEENDEEADTPTRYAAQVCSCNPTISVDLGSKLKGHLLRACTYLLTNQAAVNV